MTDAGLAFADGEKNSDALRRGYGFQRRSDLFGDLGQGLILHIHNLEYIVPYIHFFEYDAKYVFYGFREFPELPAANNAKRGKEDGRRETGNDKWLMDDGGMQNAKSGYSQRHNPQRTGASVSKEETDLALYPALLIHLTMQKQPTLNPDPEEHRASGRRALAAELPGRKSADLRKCFANAVSASQMQKSSEFAEGVARGYSRLLNTWKRFR